MPRLVRGIFCRGERDEQTYKADLIQEHEQIRLKCPCSTFSPTRLAIRLLHLKTEKREFSLIFSELLCYPNDEALVAPRYRGIGKQSEAASS